MPLEVLGAVEAVPAADTGAVHTSMLIGEAAVALGDSSDSELMEADPGESYEFYGTPGVRGPAAIPTVETVPVAPVEPSSDEAWGADWLAVEVEPAILFNVGPTPEQPSGVDQH